MKYWVGQKFFENSQKLEFFNKWKRDKFLEKQDRRLVTRDMSATVLFHYSCFAIPASGFYVYNTKPKTLTLTQRARD